MRIGVVAPPWLPVPPDGYGGTEAVIDCLSRALVRLGHAVTLFASGDSSCPVERVSCYASAVGFGLDGASREIHHTLHAWSSIERAQGSDFDIVHDHTVLGGLVASRCGAPVVPTITTNHGRFSPEMHDVYRLMDPSVGVVAVSEHQRTTSSPTPVVAVVRHGIDTEAIPPGAGGDHAVFLGRFAPEKGVARAISIAERAGVPLVIAAKMREPSEIAYFEQRIRPRLRSGVEYVGEVSGRAKWDVLGGARCLLNPIAWDEPFGLVMIEALACGTPVVAPPVATVSEIVDHGRTGFVAADDDALAAAVVAADGLDRRECRHAANDRFSSERMAREYVAVYRRVIERWSGTNRRAAR